MDIVRELIRPRLRDNDEYEAAVLANREKHLTEGFRLIAHDQVDDRKLELRDAITGDRLFYGEFDDGMSIWDETWVDIDTIDGTIEIPETAPPANDLPPGLQEAIQGWASDYQDEARAFAEGTD